MKTKYLIIGAGIGGLAAAGELKRNGIEDFVVVDSAKELPLNLSNGVHYLHSNDFGLPFDLELKKIVATEEVWDPRTDSFKKTSCIPEMIEYSMKVMGTRHPSSIMDPGTRSWDTWVPASDDMNDLLRGYHSFIGEEKFNWNTIVMEVNVAKKIAYIDAGEEIDYEHLISTAPLNKFTEICKYDAGAVEFKHNAINIVNYKTENIVKNWLICLYISDPQFPPYRITIMNNIISMESIKPMTITNEEIVHYHLSRYFDYQLSTAEKYEWKTGRIFGLSKSNREIIISQFKNVNIQLVGRFAQWDGKLLMDSTIIQAKRAAREII